MAEELRRPNGKAYRPRKAPEAMYLGNDDTDGVMVLRTHDELAHRGWAATVYRNETGLNLPMSGRATWTRMVPWDASGWGDWSWIDCDGNDSRACPAVWYEPTPSGGAS